MSAQLMSLGLSVSFAVLLTLFLEFCFREGNIFERWITFVCRVELKLKGIDFIGMDYDWLLDNTWYSKALGGCVVCCGFWLSVIILSPYYETPGIYLYGVLLSSFLIRFFHGKLL